MNLSQHRINQYIDKWKSMGYPADIPDEVPDSLMRLGLAPSYKAIAICLLKNDINLLGLGFSGVSSEWYSALKKIEIKERSQGFMQTIDLF